MDTNIVNQQITITEKAANRIKKVSDSNSLRIIVQAGGCSGFKYEYIFDNNQENPGDMTIKAYGITLLIDDISLNLINGAVIDFIEQLGNSYFEIKNPIAASGCGCGNSFSV